MKFFHFHHPSSSSSSSDEGGSKRKQSLASLFLESFNANSSYSSSSSSSPSNSTIDWKHALRFQRNKDLEQAFMVLDAEGDGYISLEEFKEWMRSFFTKSKKAEKPSEEEIAFMVAEVDNDGDEFVSFEDFRQLLFSSTSSSSSSWVVEEGAWFHAVDLNNDGVISCEELHHLMVQRLGMKSCTVQECRLMISSHDSDGDGFLNAQDFHKLLLA